MLKSAKGLSDKTIGFGVVDTTVEYGIASSPNEKNVHI